MGCGFVSFANLGLGFVADWCTDLWRICGFVRFVDLGLWRIGTLIYGRFVGYDSKGWV